MSLMIYLRSLTYFYCMTNFFHISRFILRSFVLLVLIIYESQNCSLLVVHMSLFFTKFLVYIKNYILGILGLHLTPHIFQISHFSKNGIFSIKFMFSIKVASFLNKFHIHHKNSILETFRY